MASLPRGLVAALVILLLLSPTVLAHLQGARPILQRGQRERIVDLQPIGVTVLVDLQLRGETLRNLVTHVLDPALGRLYIEHREDASVAASRFWAEWRFERFVEYRDNNVNGKFEPAFDTPVRSWRFTHYTWELVNVQAVQLEDVQGTSIIWEGNLTGAPKLRVEIAVAGKDFADEGAIVRPQDVVVYMDVTDIPQRDVGSLYSFEMTALVDPATTLSFHRVENTSTALLADAPFRRAFLVWGGEGFLDGQEQRLDATIDEERVDGLGNRTARVALHLPTTDNAMRFVLVSGIEYGGAPGRQPIPWDPALLILLVAATALAAGRAAPGRTGPSGLLRPPRR